MIFSDSLQVNQGIMRWYVKRLKSLAIKMQKECKEELKKIYKAGYPQIAFDESLSSQARMLLNTLREKFGALFTNEAKRLANGLIKQTRRYSKNQINNALKKALPPSEVNNFLLKGSAIPEAEKETIKALLFENVSLIKSIPDEYFKQITGAVARSIENGEGIQALTKQLVSFGAKTERRAQLIAQDQTRKAYNSINMRKFEQAGVKRFRWRHNGGSREPREYHKNVLNGKIFDLDKGAPNDKPEPKYIYPAQLPYCHCTMEIVFEWENE